MSTTAPSTPKRRSPALIDSDKVLSYFSSQWGLRLEPPRPGESPSERQEKLAAKVASAEDQCKKYAIECGFKVLFLCRKDKDALLSAIRGFERSASVLQSGWVPKPDADVDLLPRSIGASVGPSTGPLRISMNAKQRQILLECLLHFLKPAYDNAKTQNGMVQTRQFSRNPSFADSNGSDVSDRKFKWVDDTPIPLNLGTKSSKRSSGGNYDEFEVSKKPKLPYDGELSQNIINAVDDVPVKVHHAKPWLRCPAAPDFNTSTASGDDGFSELSDIAIISDGQILSYGAKGGDTANTSFVSEVSTVFSRTTDTDTSLSRFSTQHSSWETSNEKEMLPSPERLRRSYPEDIDVIDLSQDDPVTASFVNTIADSDMDGQYKIPKVPCDLHFAEDALRQRLQNVFPKLPNGLKNASLRYRYEVMRIFLHTKTNTDDFLVFPGNIQDYEDYNDLWRHLKDQPALKGKSFPMRTSDDVWEASKNTFHSDFNGVVLSAKLLFREFDEGPLFDVRLQPLKMEISHRLGRRFGNNRFIEISIPSITGERVPKTLRQAGAAGRKIFVQWLIHGVHEFLGVTWKPFYVKNVDNKKPKIDGPTASELDNTIRFCFFAFATDGNGFQKRKTIPERGEGSENCMKMTINDMVNWLIPLEKNKKQSFLKLFQRIALGLSKTYETVAVKYDEIRFMGHLLSSDKAEVMNDGCGQVSLKLAMEISHCLKLTYVPSGFQARIGGAKGFWIVNTQDSPDVRWIEIYRSQTKWEFEEKTVLEEKEHRTFEVLRWVQPLKSAALNLQFLPLLEERGEPKVEMRESIAQLLENGLRHGMTQQSEAMDSPQSFRVWAHNLNPGIQDRIKHGKVPYEAGLPISLEEKMNMLLDAGFDPRRQHYLKELAWKAYFEKCMLLKKKLNITVGLSTYAYMAVDFTGTLEPNEVHLCFSSAFKVESPPFSEVLLDDIDVLVARSPAHYVSDIQKVRAVWKRELKSMKDVIVFSSKGDCPLAKKLSGGDYDGDIAWVCWDPTLVEPFRNEEPPKCPDLEAMGYIKKNRTLYAEIASEFADDPVSVFLERSFDFNLEYNFLGLCTNYKEDLSYTINNVNSDSIVLLSTLLSYLVDQNKQGYKFTKEDWENLKANEIRTKPRRPFYKSDKFEGKTPTHIVDFLKFVVAEKTVEATLTEFHNSLKHAEYWDEDVVKYSRWADKQGGTSNDWKVLLVQLRQDIKAVRDLWTAKFEAKESRDVENTSNFRSIIVPLHQKWLDIKPSKEVSPLLSKMLLPSGLPNEEVSEWALLKASVAFASFSPRYVSKFVWWMSGRQLALLKVRFRGRDNSLVALTPEMYAMLKPNNTFVKLQRAEENEPRFWEAKAEGSVVLEDEPAGDDDD